MNGKAGGLSLHQAFPFTLQAKLDDTTLNITGETDLKIPSGQIRIQLDELNLIPFSPYFRDRLPGKVGALKLALDLTIAGDTQALTSTGRISLPEIDVVLNNWPETPIQNAHASLDYDLKVDPTRPALYLTKVDADLNGIHLGLSGMIKNYVAAPQLDLALNLPDLDVRTMLAALPKGLFKSAAELDPAGQVTAFFKLRGSSDQPLAMLQQGEIQLANVQFSSAGLRPALTGKVTLAGDQIAGEKLNLTLGDHAAEVSFKAGNLFDRPVVLSSVISAKNFPLDPLFKGNAVPATTTGEPLEREAAPANKVPKAEIGPFDLPIKADGEVRIEQTAYHGLAIENFFLRYRLLDNLLTIETMTGQIAGGSFSETTTIDLGKKGPAYQGELNLKEVRADALLKAFAPQTSDMVFGNLSLEADFSGQGTLAETIRKNLSGQGEFSITNGRLTALPLVQGLADFIRLDELRHDLVFDRATGNYRMQNGKISLNSDISGQDVTMTPTGTIGLDNQLDLVLGTRLSPTLTAKLDRKGEVSRLFTDQEGWSELPLLVTGTLDKPHFAFDAKAVKARAGDKLQRKLQEKVFKKLDSDTETSEPTKQLLQETIKGLFDK